MLRPSLPPIAESASALRREPDPAKKARLRLLVLIPSGRVATQGEAAEALPENVIPLFLRSYSPELNPVERLWQDLKMQIDARDEAVRALGTARSRSYSHHRYSGEALASFTGCAYLVGAAKSLQF